MELTLFTDFINKTDVTCLYKEFLRGNGKIQGGKKYEANVQDKRNQNEGTGKIYVINCDNSNDKIKNALYCRQ